MSLSPSPKRNQILAALPDTEYRRLMPFLERVDMPLGQVIYEPNTTIRKIYFPVDSIIARMYELESGSSRQVSMIGNEGISDMFFLQNCSSTPATVIVQNAGYGYGINASILKKEFDSGGVLQHALLRFNQALFLQTEQSAVAHRQTIAQQLCHFLLMSLDRSLSSSLIITHEFVSHLLGVRRESVTQAAQLLQTGGAIEYRRGHITILNRKWMEEHVNDGYMILKKEYFRLLINSPMRAA